MHKKEHGIRTVGLTDMIALPLHDYISVRYLLWDPKPELAFVSSNKRCLTFLKFQLLRLSPIVLITITTNHTLLITIAV